MYIELQTIKKYEQEKFFRKTFGEIKNSINFAPLSKRKLWKDGRVVDYTGLENRRAERHRGFESLSFRGRIAISFCLSDCYSVFYFIFLTNGFEPFPFNTPISLT